MPFFNDVPFNQKTIIKFYKNLKNINFSLIDEARKQELDYLLKLHEYYFCNNKEGTMIRAYFTSEKLLTSPKRFGLTNSAEIVYFYINIVDPKLRFLEIYECANTSDELKHNCLSEFQYYDKYLIVLERYYNMHFQIFGPNELWSKDSIKRTRIPKKD